MKYASSIDWADLREDEMSNTALSCWLIFGPLLVANGGPREPRGRRRLENSAP